MNFCDFWKNKYIMSVFSMYENLCPYHCWNNFEELKNKMDLCLTHLHFVLLTEIF